MTLGTSGKPSNTGATSIDYRTICHAGEPFYFPTNIALAADGAIYVTDGYGNARVHKFTADGQLLFSWGSQAAIRDSFVSRMGSRLITRTGLRGGSRE